MASAKHMTALISAHLQGDDERFRKIVLQAAAHAESAGQKKTADELRALVAKQAPSRLPTPPSSIEHVPTSTRLSDVSLSEEIVSSVRRVLVEHEASVLLAERGVGPTNRLLFVGPPGTGKTMTAGAIATELGLPMFSVRLGAVVKSFLGETAAALTKTFEYIRATNGVFVFDEVDALARARSSSEHASDAEMSRTVNALLQLLDSGIGGSVLIGTTNMSDVLDKAIVRRFDIMLRFEHPTTDVATRLMRERLSCIDTGAVDWTVVAQATVGLHHAAIAKSCDRAIRRSVIDQTVLCTQSLLDELATAAA